VFWPKAKLDYKIIIDTCGGATPEASGDTTFVSAFDQNLTKSVFRIFEHTNI